MKYLLLLIAFWIVTPSVKSMGQTLSKPDARILLIPLDDRPPCLQFPVKMGLIGNLEVTSPPKNLLGNFTTPGQPEKIAEWVLAQDLSKTEALIVSIDMLVYGGLVASRVSEISEADAANRLAFLKEVKRKAPHLKIYASSVRMRLAPTADGNNESWREKLNQWASLARSEANQNQILSLEKEIPADVLAKYKTARTRNFAINLLALELAEKKEIDFLIVGQDDAAPHGIHRTESDSIRALIQKKNLADRVVLQAGADEAAMLLLSRFQSDKSGLHPKTKVVYSSEKMADRVMPFEDKPLKETVAAHLKTCGAEQVEEDWNADVFFFVFTSRREDLRSIYFGKEIIKFIDENATRKIIVADIDPIGDIQGGDTMFTETLLRNYGKGLLSERVIGYASWNTAANAIGTALPQGIIQWSSNSKTDRTFQTREEMKIARRWFMIHRILNDYYFHGYVRPGMKAEIKKKGWNPLKLTKKQVSSLEETGFFNLETFAQMILKTYVPSWSGAGISDFTFRLPWGRLFEAEIDFRLGKR